MKRILITRPRAQAESFASALQAVGYQPVYFPVIEIRPVADFTALDRALGKLGRYDWVVFTSVNGVEAFYQRMKNLGLEKMPENVQVAAIGPKTAAALQEYGIFPSFVPQEYIAEAILPGLGDLRGRWVLLPRAEIARKALPAAISKAEGVAHEIAVYHTLPARPDPAGLAALQSGVDVITLTSPSTVHNFVEIARQVGLDPVRLPGNPLYACIGPITHQAASEEGLSNLIVAEQYTTEGIIQAIREHSKNVRLAGAPANSKLGSEE